MSAASANHVYLAAGTATKSAKPVANYELYKTLRTAELQCYRHLCRVAAMHHGGAQPRAAVRLLEDARTALSIDDKRHEVEMAAAAADAVIAAVCKSGVSAAREPYFDSSTDIALPTNAGSDSEDDGGAVGVAAAQPSSGGRGRTVKRGRESALNVKPPTPSGRSTPLSAEAAAEKRRLADIKACGVEITKLAAAFVHAAAQEQRSELKQQLLAKQEVLRLLALPAALPTTEELAVA
jgi:hypothetical protein